ncbi:MAG: UDP-N-acetylmuramate--alanine ligase [Burkholderiales bacterium]
MHDSRDSLRAEIAAAAARFIADGGLDYASARRKAAAEVGEGRLPRGSLPDHDEIDEALREHLALFDDQHADRVRALRETALELMARLETFRPLVTGAAWKGIAAEHAPLHLQLFADNPKEVSYWLLNQGIDFEVDTIAHFQGRGEAEVLGFLWQDTPVMLSLHEPDDLRGALRAGTSGPTRGDRAALARRMQEESA